VCVVCAAGPFLSCSALTPESQWFPRLASPEAIGALPLMFERKMTLKWPQRMGVGTVLQAVDLHHIDTGEVKTPLSTPTPLQSSLALSLLSAFTPIFLSHTHS